MRHLIIATLLFVQVATAAEDPAGSPEPTPSPGPPAAAVLPTDPIVRPVADTPYAGPVPKEYVDELGYWDPPTAWTDEEGHKTWHDSFGHPVPPPSPELRQYGRCNPPYPPNETPKQKAKRIELSGRCRAYYSVRVELDIASANSRRFNQDITDVLGNEAGQRIACTPDSVIQFRKLCRRSLNIWPEDFAALCAQLPSHYSLSSTAQLERLQQKISSRPMDILQIRNTLEWLVGQHATMPNCWTTLGGALGMWEHGKLPLYDRAPDHPGPREVPLPPADYRAPDGHLQDSRGRCPTSYQD